MVYWNTLHMYVVWGIKNEGKVNPVVWFVRANGKPPLLNNAWLG